MPELPEDPAADWPSVVKKGDVVRSEDGRGLGVVLAVVDSSENGNPPHWELHVDGAIDGALDGVGIWRPWQAVIANDAASREEARRLGLRGA